MGLFRIVLLSAILCLASAGIAVPSGHSTGGPAGAWDREGAAKYLDERMDVWFEKAKKLRTGREKTACISCHTTVPYVMARPALRRAMKIGEPAPQEARLIDEITRRVADNDAHQPFYDHTESKKTESRGTESVLNALMLACADAAQGRREPGAATRQAFLRLWATQRTDGAWDWLDFGLEPFESNDGAYYGAALAALAIGTAPGGPRDRSPESIAGLAKLRGYLKEKYAAQKTFNRTWLLLAAARLPYLLAVAQREALLKEIQSLQRADGGWALDSLGPWRWDKAEAPFRAPGTLDAALLARSDGYATGLIVYTLRQAGVSTGHPAVARGLQWLRANQQSVQVGEHAWPAWRAHSLNFDREHGGEKGEPWRRLFMSDAATAFAVLALTASDNGPAR